MNPRKNLSILFLLAILLTAVVISGCTTSPAASPTAGTPAGTVTPAVSATAVPSAAVITTLPHTFTGNGEQNLGPVRLNAGTATFVVKCPDLKLAGFVAELDEAPSGKLVTMITSSADPGQPANAIDATKTVNVPSTGDYYIKVIANSAADWNVTVSQ